jgi:predicted transcriptional regulator
MKADLMQQDHIIRVRDVMKHHVDQIDSMATVQQALQTMQHVETKTLIVKKRHPDDVIGMLTLPTIAKEVIAKDRAAERVNVYEIMSKPALTVSPDMDIRYCARLFDQFHLARAPVVDQDDNVIGVISLTDMVLRGLCQNSHKSLDE